MTQIITSIAQTIYLKTKKRHQITTGNEDRDYTDAINHRLTSSAEYRPMTIRKLHIVLVIIAMALLIYHVAVYPFHL